MSSLDHIGVTVSDFAAAKAFYGAALKPLGISVQMEVTKAETGGTYEGAGFGTDGKPFFWVGGGGTATAGVHVAFVARSRAEVDAFHAAAIAAGGKDNGPPGIRAHYHPTYYGAFVLDADGNNVEAVCHKPE
jgi:catechol 2,3-dioxygenase-like lactoylglutathione lyase family enzyme